MNSSSGERVPVVPVNTDAGSQNGFTLLEAVMVMMIVTILLAIAMPSAARWMDSRSTGNAADQFQFQLQRAKMLAIKEHTDVAVIIDIDKNQYYIARTSTNTITADAEKYDLAQMGGHVVFKDENDDVTFIRFIPSGIAPDRGSVYIAAADGTDTYRVRVTGAGGVSKRRVVNE